MKNPFTLPKTSKSKRKPDTRDNPAGTKMYHRSLPTSRRGCDGTLRR